AYPGVRVPNILKIGGWIGGDRDGNPFVSAETLRFAFRRHADAVFRFYRGELDKLYRELPLSIRRVKVNDDVMALAALSPDEEIARTEEPYRRAIAYIMARAMGKARSLGLGMGCKFGFLEPYATVEEFLNDLKKLQRSLHENGSQLLAEGRLADIIRSVSVFGFHMMPLDLRQHAGKHADVVAELFQHAGLEDYNSLNEEQKQ
ncbi:phosphoenolpyruvate carboxylase, partial [Neisseria sp. P0006.S006]